MVKELFQYHVQELSLSITNNRVEAIRRKNILKSGCRVYDRGLIGVAGTLGEPTEETWQAAEDALSLGIACPLGPTKDLKRSRSLGQMPEEQKFIQDIQEILTTLKEEFPRFILSNRVKASRHAITLRNDSGLDLGEDRCLISVELVVKDETSANVMDSFIEYEGAELDSRELLRLGREILTAHSNPVPLNRDLPVVMPGASICRALADFLDGGDFYRGATLFSGKLGQKLFSHRFTLESNRGADSPNRFFDSEGTTLPEDRLALIEEGVLRRAIADKKCASEFGCDLTGAGSGEYDDVPRLGVVALDVAPTGSLAQILPEGEALMVVEAGGGDTTPAGDFATPVQVAYWMKDGHLVGKVPEFNFSGSLFDLLGSGYLGCVREKILGQEHTVVIKGNIRP